MKKLLALAVVMLLAGSSYAGIDYGLDAGSTRFGIYGGMSSPTTDWTWGGPELDKNPAGKTGPIFGVEFIRNITPVFALGFDLGYSSYPGQTISDALGDSEAKSNVFNGSVLARINFFPSQPTRVYIPFGAGLNYFRTEVDGESANTTAPSLTAGLGVEFDLSDIWTLGVEGRYSQIFINDDAKFGSDNDKFSSFNAMVKLGMRF